MFISGSVGLAVFALFPVSPPRFLDGFTDTVASRCRAQGAVAHPSGFTNEYAAMPSFHVGWTVLAGVVVFGVLRHRILRWAALVPGAVMSMTVVVTANHYVLDALAGIVVSLLGLWLAREAHRIRERRRSVVFTLPTAAHPRNPGGGPEAPAYGRSSVAAWSPTARSPLAVPGHVHVLTGGRGCVTASCEDQQGARYEVRFQRHLAHPRERVCVRHVRGCDVRHRDRRMTRPHLGFWGFPHRGPLLSRGNPDARRRAGRHAGPTPRSK